MRTDPDGPPEESEGAGPRLGASPRPAGAPALSVVVPVRDEAESIRPLLDEIAAALEGRASYEIVYVNDGSRDGTPAALAEARADFPALRVVTHARSFGQSAALYSGIKASRGEWIVTLDGDGQNPPAEIPKLLAARDAAASPALAMVAGFRERRRDSWDKRVSSRLANLVRRRLLGDGVVDSGCGLKLFRRDAFLALPAFNHMHRYLPALVMRGGGEVVQVAVAHRPRERGRSKYGVHNRLWVSLVDLFGVLWLKRRALRPIIESGD